MLGYNPIELEYIDIEEWLKKDKDNIIIHLISSKKIKDNILCLNKNHFITSYINDIYLECLYENDVLMKKKTYTESPEYRNIGFFYNHYTMINNKEFNKLIKKKNNQLFNLTIRKTDKLFINKEFMKLSEIGIYKIPRIIKYDDTKDKTIFNQNLPYKEEVYFNTLISTALTNYSGTWYKPINGYLRFGEKYFNENKNTVESYANLKLFGGGMGDKNKTLKNCIKVGTRCKSHSGPMDNLCEISDKNRCIIKKNMNINKVSIKKNDTQPILSKFEKGKKNIKERIKLIDQCFMDLAPRNEDENTVYYRGMKGDYGHKQEGDEVLVKNFISITKNKETPKGFMDLTKNNKRCCFFEIKLLKGLPYIDMVTTSKYKKEQEILLPRDIILKLIKITKDVPSKSSIKYVYDIYHLEAYPSVKNQFKIKTGCKNYDLGFIEPMKMKIFKEIISKNQKEISDSEEKDEKSPVIIIKKTKKKTNINKKSCMRIKNRCTPHQGPMEEGCKLSEKNRCVKI